MRRLILASTCLVVLAVAAAGCSRKGPEGGARAQAPGGARGRGGAVFPVEVEPVAGRSVEYSVSAVGSIDAFEIVQVTARVAGAVEEVHFKEGDRVRKGDLLVEIEPTRYRLAVKESEAAVARQEAALAEAELGLSRREKVNATNPGILPGEEIDTWRTRVATQKAELASSKAALEMSQRNQSDALARAPFNGIIQTRSVSTGQYVQPGSLLTTLVRRDPLLLRFDIPDGDAANLTTGMTARFAVRGAPVTHDARIISVGESADPNSRMVAVTAEVVSDDASLRPGAFAEVTIPVGESRHAAVIPQTAVRPSERGFLAYIVDGGKARERILVLGLRTADGLVEVTNGLAIGDSLVVRGAEALREGASVKIVANTSGPPGARAPGDAVSPMGGHVEPAVAAPGSRPS